MTTRDSDWDPEQYNRFATERELPFWDLVELIAPGSIDRAVDLGCGDGRLTNDLAVRRDIVEMRGIDSSPNMIEAAQSLTGPSTFSLGDISSFSDDNLDLVFSNAALHWVPNHADVIGSWTRSLAPRGQLAVQVPCNASHPIHELAGAVALEFVADPVVDPVALNVLEPRRYAELLHSVGYVEQRVRQETYLHILESPVAAVEWIKGSTLNRLKPQLGDRFDEYIEVLKRRVEDTFPDQRPYAFSFQRILMWARLP